MSFQEILGIASVVMLLFWILYGVYQRAKGNAFGMIAEFIAYAENTGLAGPEKMAMVVDNLYEIIPAPFKLILTRERLREAAQNVYEWMKAYALEYIKKKSGEAAENLLQRGSVSPPAKIAIITAPTLADSGTIHSKCKGFIKVTFLFRSWITSQDNSVQ